MTKALRGSRLFGVPCWLESIAGTRIGDASNGVVAWDDMRYGPLYGAKKLAKTKLALAYCSS